MYLSTLASLLAAVLILGFYQSSEAHIMPSSTRQRSHFPVLFERDPSEYDTFEDDLLSRPEIRKGEESVPPKRFESIKDMERYAAALNTYYMIFGRPR